MDRFDRHPRHGWPEKTITFPGRFLFQSPPLPGNRILGGPCGVA
ncbi:hypothetical protein [Bifidobacterium adolescentis]|nr:hypothetical protein [Bifidobacterium adolescentis]